MAVSPKISIITAAYNIEDFVEATLTSVVGQKQANTEYIFVDGASTDSTLAIAKRYSKSIDHLISEPDQGQYHAIAKGAALAKGEIMGWINADDILMPWALNTVANIFDTFPDVDWITGLPSFLNESGQLTSTQSKLPNYPREFVRNGWYTRNVGAYLQQESMFWRRSLWERVGGLDTRYSLAADFDLWTRFANHAELIPVNTPLAAFRSRTGQRSGAAAQYDAEVARICQSKKPPPKLWHWLANRGNAPRALARLLISRKGDAISYDKARGSWVKTRRRRSISRFSFSALLEEQAKARPSHA